MTTITIHGFAPSTYTRSCRMAALEKGVAHDLEPLAYGEASHLALHPFGKMPAMTHDAVTLYETLAILSYIDAAFDGPALFPPGPADPARVLGAISAAIDYGYRPVVHTGKDDDGKVDPDDKAKADAFLDWLDQQLADGGYVVGDRLSAADLVAAPMVAYHEDQVGGAFKGRGPLKTWYTAMADRPSFKATAAS